MRIALDAMGGDYAPKSTIEGAVLALKEYTYIEKLFLVGDAVATGNELKRLDFEDARIEIFHASEVVSMKEAGGKGGSPQEGRVDLSCDRSGQRWIGSRGRFRWTHRGSSRGLLLQTPDTERNRTSGRCLPAADREQRFRFDRWGSKPGLNPEKSGSVRNYGLRFFGARPWLQQPFSRVNIG